MGSYVYVCVCECVKERERVNSTVDEGNHHIRFTYILLHLGARERMREAKKTSPPNERLAKPRGVTRNVSDSIGKALHRAKYLCIQETYSDG